MKIKSICIAMAAAAAVMALMVGCGSGNASSSGTGTTVVNQEEAAMKEAMESYLAEEASRDYVAEKVPDPTAPKVEVVSIYRPKDDTAVGLKQSMDDVEELDEYELFLKLVDYGVIDEDADLVSYEEQDGRATLELSGLKNQNRNNLVGITNTYTENLGLESITLIVEGKTLLENQTFVKNYKEIE